MGSKSNSTKRATNNNSAQTVGADNGSQSFNTGGSVHIVADEAFDLGEDALDFGRDSLVASLGTVDSTTGRAFSFADDASDRSFDVVERTLDKAFTFGRDALEDAAANTNSAYSDAAARSVSEEQQTTESLIKVALPMIVLGVVAMQWSKS